MKSKLFFTLLFISTFMHAQNLKVKKGEILLDKKKVGSLEKIKVKGATNYYEVRNNQNELLYNAKLVSEESKFFGKAKRNDYYIIECVKENDSIGIENDWFYLGKKQIAKYLLKNGILSTNGFSASKTKELISTTNSRPGFVLEKVEKENEFIKNIGYKVERDKRNPLYIVKVESGVSWSVMDEKSINQTIYEIYQGENKEDSVLIGYAYIEFGDMGGKKLIISNVKECPIGYFDNAWYYTFYPLTELKPENLSSKKHLDKTIEAIYQFSQMLIANDKL
ncbi:hypothetical protein OOZ15_19285 [Galbibacter sp. EGI 63066]|uniref:hypothetical protein n=1 Tax=Galbibacter sp. EGI 63066 TaxID=2993559 RepID=UPI002248D8E7|nr:hypothetical protein [Galbibacter sp. EGI 63066]MCX2682102.1 hypothetical protein [Galbibacter sp. EGI 63066]